MVTAPQKPCSDITGSEKITEIARITWLLERLMKRHELLTVTIDGSQEKFTSAIIQVDTKNHHIVLDELVPGMGHQLLTGKRRFFAKSKLDGIQVDFNSMLEDTSAQDGTFFYITRLPKQINYWQHRASYRVRLPIGDATRAVLGWEDDKLDEGWLRDLSQDGAKIVLPPDTRNRSRGILQECVLQLPDVIQLFSTVEVCHVTLQGMHNELYVGVRFVDITPVQRRMIEHCVAQLVWRQNRKLAGD